MCEAVVGEPPWVAVVDCEWRAFGEGLGEWVHGFVSGVQVDVELLVVDGEVCVECCDGLLVVVEEGGEEGCGCKGSECKVCGWWWWRQVVEGEVI